MGVVYEQQSLHRSNSTHGMYTTHIIVPVMLLLITAALFSLFVCSSCRPARTYQRRRHGRPPTNALATNCTSQIPRFAHGNTHRDTSTYASRGGKAVST